MATFSERVNPDPRKYAHVRRRLIVCCDGTWQSSVSGERNIPSNVTRLCRHLHRWGESKEKGELTLWQQMVFYDPGIGTGDLSYLDTVRQGGTGAGLAANVIEGYNWLVMNYQPGDKIYCFGFSRGAYTARALAGMITELGVCHPLDMQSFPTLYELYESNTGADTPAAKKIKADYEDMKNRWLKGQSIPIVLGDPNLGGSVKFESSERRPIPESSKHIEVVGVWDTVGSLGVPSIFGRFKLPSLPFLKLDQPSRIFHDVSLSSNVKHAFHALALDERRRPFSPTLWYIPYTDTRDTNSSLEQVWFPGVHINVGGGSDDVLEAKVSDFEQIANITFAWMIERVRPYLAFDEESFLVAIEEQTRLLKELDGKERPWPEKWFQKVGTAVKTLWSKVVSTVIAKAGWAIGPIIDSYEEADALIKLGGVRVRSPGETSVPESITQPKEVRTSKLGLTKEFIHPSVWYRMKMMDSKYKPASLEGWNRRECAGSTPGWEWFKIDKEGHELVLPECRIGLDKDVEETATYENLERLVAEAGNATSYLKVLDAMYATGIDKSGDVRVYHREVSGSDSD